MLPKVFNRTGERFSTLPKFITDNPKIVVNFVDDIGPATKIVPTCGLLASTNPDYKIISVDDDVYYHPNLAETHLKAYSIYPNVIITGTTFIIDNEAVKIPGAYFSYLLEGFSGVLYTAKSLGNRDTSIFSKLSKECFLADDYYLSNYLIKNGYKIVSIETRELVHPLSYGFLGDALHALDDLTQEHDNDGLMLETQNIKNYRKCNVDLQNENNLYIQNIPKFIQA